MVLGLYVCSEICLSSWFCIRPAEPPESWNLKHLKVWGKRQGGNIHSNRPQLSFLRDTIKSLSSSSVSPWCSSLFLHKDGGNKSVSAWLHRPQSGSYRLLGSAEGLEAAGLLWGDPGPRGTTLSPPGAMAGSVLIRCTMLDRQSKLEMIDGLVLLESVGKKRNISLDWYTIDKSLSHQHNNQVKLKYTPANWEHCRYNVTFLLIESVLSL